MSRLLPAVLVSIGTATAAHAQIGSGAPGSPNMDPMPAGVQSRQNQFFRYLCPPGWQVGEEGQFAVVLTAPDRQALTFMSGNCGLFPGTDPARVVYEKLSVMQLAGLQLSPPRPSAPIPGFAMAYDFDYVYAYGGIPCQGLAKCSINQGYDNLTMVVTAAASVASQWPGYAGWLPQVASRIEVLSPQAWGCRAFMQQSLQNSIQLRDQATQAREWSRQQWDAATRQREASQDAQAFDRGQVLSGTERYQNPYSGSTVDLDAGNAVYWVHPQTGRIVGSPDPGFDPRSPMDPAWQPMPKSRPGR